MYTVRFTNLKASFRKPEIDRICIAFRMDLCPIRERLVASPRLALCVLLYILSKPWSLHSAPMFFGRSDSWCSIVFTSVLDYLRDRYAELIVWDPRWLTLQQLQRYAEIISKAGGPDNVWGFVDGTNRGIARPVEGQEDYYSGYKKHHSIKFQGLVTPDGLISHLGGPRLGRIGDWKFWIESGMPEILAKLFDGVGDAEKLWVYGDRAYSNSNGVIGAISRIGDRPLTRKEYEHNVAMSQYRISVEWSFGKVVNLWEHCGYAKGLRVGLQAVGAMYVVAVLLTNVHSCLYGCQVAQYFNTEPPSLEDYLHVSSTDIRRRSTENPAWSCINKEY